MLPKLGKYASFLFFNSIRLEFYKMVIYRPGDHFKEHKDTIRDVNHFGTLVILPPSEYEGNFYFEFIEIL